MTDLNRVFKQAVALIDAIPDDEKGSYSLIVRGKSLMIIKPGAIIEKDIEISILSAFERQAGLTAKGWEIIRGCIMGLLTGDLLE